MMMKLKILVLAFLFLFFHSNSIFAFRLSGNDSIPKFKYDSLSLRYIDLLEDLKNEKSVRKALVDQIEVLKTNIELCKIDRNQKDQKNDSLKKVNVTIQKKLRSNENEKIDTLLSRIARAESCKVRLESELKSSKSENDSLKKSIVSLNQDRIKFSNQRYIDGKKELCDLIQRYYAKNTFEQLVKVSSTSNVLKDKEILLDNNVDVKVLDGLLKYFELENKIRRVTLGSDVLELIEGLNELNITSELIERQAEYLNNYRDILLQFSAALSKLESLSREIRTTEMQIANQKSQMIYLIFRLDYDWEISKSNFDVLKTDMVRLIEDINSNPKVDVQVYRSKYNL